MSTTIQGPELAELRRKHDKFISRAKADGDRVVAYTCPHPDCRKTIETVAPTTRETWDSLCNCPHCGQLFKKEVSLDYVLCTVPEVFQQC